MMDGMMLAMAEALPKEKIIELLKSMIADYEADPCEKSLSHITMTCSLLVAKDVIDFKGGFKEVLTDMERSKEANKMFNNIMQS